MSIQAENALSESTDVAHDTNEPFPTSMVHYNEHTRNNKIIYHHLMQVGIIGFLIQPPANSIGALVW